MKRFTKVLFVSLILFQSLKLQAESPYTLLKEPEKKRNYFFPAFFSLLLPGLDQWIEEQYKYAQIYSGVGVGGLLWATSSTSHTLWRNWVSDKDTRLEIYSLGLEAYQAVGAASLYHSFRSAVKTQQPYGKFTFLEIEESPKDLFLAPFQFSHLEYWTSYVPLSLGLALSGLVIAAEKDKQLYGSELLFSFSKSYTAGTSEEMVFRGWMLPMFYQLYGSFFWSNVSTSLLFAAAHYPNVRVPWPQFILGYHFAYVSKKRNWTLSESIFIHSWWDILLFVATSFAVEKNIIKTSETIRVPLLQGFF